MDAYPSDHWSLATAVIRADEDSQRRLIGGFLRHYRKPCLEHLRQTVPVVSMRAEDVMELFTVDQWVLDAVRTYVATPATGLRGFVRDLLTQYVEICDGTRYEDACEAQTGAIQPYDRLWAHQVMAESMMMVKDRCMACRNGVWDRIDMNLLRPLMDEVKNPRWDTTSDTCQDELTQMFRQAMRRTITEYACSDADAEQEMQDLRQIALHAGLLLCRLF